MIIIMKKIIIVIVINNHNNNSISIKICLIKDLYVLNIKWYLENK